MTGFDTPVIVRVIGMVVMSSTKMILVAAKVWDDIVALNSAVSAAIAAVSFAKCFFMYFLLVLMIIYYFMILINDIGYVNLLLLLMVIVMPRGAILINIIVVKILSLVSTPVGTGTSSQLWVSNDILATWLPSER